ncbi:MAG: hypothetical protein LBG60_15695 [Bifidobacteriaceae bacterium]|jgi:hypothetical protein|nr:hypothetical protein [Bifidobacteriaceae bacterium]
MDHQLTDDRPDYIAFHASTGAIGPHVQFDPDTAVELLTNTVTVPPAVSRWVERSIGESDAP